VATLADAVEVGRLLEASYPALMASAYGEAALAPALELMTRANPALLCSGTYYVATAPAGELVGCGGWTLEKPGTSTVEAGVAHLRHFATHPDWTRRGVGQAIYRQCEAAARSAGVLALECSASLNAERFYPALGVARVREIDLELRPGVALRSVLMRHEFIAGA
jgi:GNAT superfamily N-acetyltransferase